MMARRVERLSLAASFVVTVATTSSCRENQLPVRPEGVGQKSRSPIGPDDPSPQLERNETPAHLFRNEAGECQYMERYGCPPEARCNPPGPLPAECPEEMRDGAPPSDPLAPTKAGWVRIKERFAAYRGKCWFHPDHFCPLPGQDAENECESAAAIQLDCTMVPDDGRDADVPPGGQPGWHWVAPFSATRAAERCVHYQGFWCESPGCKLPPAQPVDCES